MQTVELPSRTDQAQPAGQLLQVVMIGLGEEIFAIDADIVREIIDPVPATRVAGARHYLPSLINVRGNIVPLADLRQRFGMPPSHDTADTRVVVVEIVIDDTPVSLGIKADKVLEVTELPLAGMYAAPRAGLSWRAEFVRNIAKWRGDFVIVPDLEKILG